MGVVRETTIEAQRLNFTHPNPYIPSNIQTIGGSAFYLGTFKRKRNFSPNPFSQFSWKFFFLYFFRCWYCWCCCHCILMFIYLQDFCKWSIYGYVLCLYTSIHPSIYQSKHVCSQNHTFIQVRRWKMPLSKNRFFDLKKKCFFLCLFGALYSIINTYIVIFVQFWYIFLLKIVSCVDVFFPEIMIRTILYKNWPKSKKKWYRI